MRRLRVMRINDDGYYEYGNRDVHYQLKNDEYDEN
jgi:hypothetical protein